MIQARNDNGSASNDDTFSLIRNALTASDAFADWPAAMVDRMVQSARLRWYDRGARVPTGRGPERQILLVVSGFVEVSQIAATGRRFLLGIIGAGHATGFIRLFEDASVDYGYFVRERSAVIHLQCDEMLACLAEHPALWERVAQGVLSRHVSMLGTVLDQVVVGPADRRIAATLHRLAITFGVDSGEAGLTLRLRLSQDDLADMLCVSRQTVNKELRRLADAGIVANNYNMVTILNHAALSRLVDGR